MMTNDKDEILQENQRLREIVAATHRALDAAGVGSPALRLSERVALGLRAAEQRGMARAREEIRITIEQLGRWRRDDEMERSEFGTWLYRDAVLALLRRGAGGEEANG